MLLTDLQHAYKPKYSIPQRPASAQPGRPMLWALHIYLKIIKNALEKILFNYQKEFLKNSLFN